MMSKGITKKLCFILLNIFFLSGCSSITNQSKNFIPSKTATSIVINASTQTTPIETATTEPTKTSEPTLTPTIPPLQPAPLTRENIQNIQLISRTEFFQKGILIDAEWSPDGEKIIVTTDKDLQIVDSENLDIIHNVRGYKFVQFLQDGNLLLSDYQGLPEIFDMQSYEFSPIDAEFPSNDWGIATNAYAIRSDGKVIADVSTPNTIKLTDIETGESTEFNYFLGDHPRVDPQAVAFSPDGNYLYISTPLSFQINETLVFDLERQQFIAAQPVISGLPTFSPDGKRLAYRKGRYISLYTFLLAPWSDHSAYFQSDLSDEEVVSYNEVAYSFIQDSSQIGILYQGTIYNYSKDERRSTATIIIYNTNGGSVERFINDIPATSIDLGFNPDGSKFFTLSEEGYIQLWGASDGDLLLTSEPYKPNTHVSVSPDGELYAFSIGDSVRILNSSDGEIITEYSDSNLSQDKFITFKDTATFAISYNNQINTYDIESSEWIRKYPELAYCDFNRSGNIMICSGMDLKLFNAETGISLLNFRPSNYSYQFTVSDDGAYTAFCNVNSESVFLWDTQKGYQIRSLKMNNQPACGSLDFSADGQFLISSLGAVWQIPEGDLILEIPLQVTGNTSRMTPIIDIGPNNKFVLIYPYIYDLENGKLLTEITPGGEQINNAWFLPDGFTLILQSENTIQFWGVLE
jgi:Tol biopolymer transport system component